MAVSGDYSKLRSLPAPDARDASESGQLDQWTNNHWGDWDKGWDSI